MKHIVSFSGGKDSTAMLLRMLELKMPIDEVRYLDHGTWEFPQMTQHINEVERCIKIPITKLKCKYTFDHYFSEYERETNKGEKVKGYGFPFLSYRWCTTKKAKVLNKEIDKHKTILYIGFNLDEKRRANSKSLEKYYVEYPLINWGWDRKKVLQYCYLRGFYWGGLYNFFSGVSCWCCPFKRITEFRNLRLYFPDLWQRLKEMQKISKNDFLSRGVTIFDLDKRFEDEENHKLLNP